MDDPVVHVYQHSGRYLEEVSLENRIKRNKEWALVNNLHEGEQFYPPAGVWEVWVKGDCVGYGREAEARHQMVHYLRGERCFWHLWGTPGDPGDAAQWPMHKYDYCQRDFR
jgi:hypothetical protein